MRGCSRGAQKARKDKEALGAFEAGYADCKGFCEGLLAASFAPRLCILRGLESSLAILA